MRQHELYMLLQQQAAHSVELHKSAQLDSVEPQRNEQPDVLDLQRNVDISELQRNAQLEAKRKTHHESHECHRNEQLAERMKLGQEKVGDLSLQTDKKSSVCSSPSNSCSKVFASSPLLESFSAANKLEEDSYKYSEQPSISSSSPASMLLTKIEANDGSDPSMEQGSSSPLQDDMHGYSVQRLSPSMQHQLSYINQPTNVENAENFASVIKLSELKTCDIETPLDLKPAHVSEEAEAAELTTDAIKAEGLPTISSCKIFIEPDVCKVSAECQHFLCQETDSAKVDEDEELRKGERLSPCFSEIELCIGKGTCSTQTDFTDTFESPSSEMDFESILHHVKPSTKTNEIMDLNMRKESSWTDSVTSGPLNCKEDTCAHLSDVKCMNDPLAGMNTLVAASEMPQACCLPLRSTAVLTTDPSADSSLLKGIVLLSEIAEIELERRKQMDNLQNCHIKPSLESLLAVSSQMLMEVLSSPTLDYLKAKSIQLPRELTLNKKYSWKPGKNTPHFSIASTIEDMDTVELDCRGNDPKHTSRLCKGYLNKKESDGVQSPDLNPIKMVWVYSQSEKQKVILWIAAAKQGGDCTAVYAEGTRTFGYD
ncbi:unnamed protein product [Ranitomeya imitator]|uniref:Uncharacterized protein n=1 Tax=Ranitomeya imitator TaxID=111125 RepID=A0ABN9M102_9NEOB|nr:unnamed protein product [Ranitomeya imitator]